MIIAVVNIKGGTAKTTSAIALATAATRAGLTACVLDADPQGSASEWALAAEECGSTLPFRVKSANVASIRRMTSDSSWIFIDCPPTGSVTDEAISKADFVVVPTTPSKVDMVKTEETVSVLESRGVMYGVLLTRVNPITKSFKWALKAAVASDMSTFEEVIPKREALVNAFGHVLDGDLFGYDKVFNEIYSALSDSEEE